MDRDGTLDTPSPLRQTRKSRVALCYAEGTGRQWEAFCLSFDLAVQDLVTVDYAQPGEDIRPRNLASMIRQSGLPKSTFR